MAYMMLIFVEQTVRTRTPTGRHMGINELKKVYQLQDENDYLLANSQIIMKKWKNYFLIY
jgi:hypothetical protein